MSIKSVMPSNHLILCHPLILLPSIFPSIRVFSIGKDPDAGKDWGREEKGTTEDEMDGWHHWLSGHEFGWTPGVGDLQGGLACCGSCSCKELDTTEWLNWTERCSPFANTLSLCHIYLIPKTVFFTWEFSVDLTNELILFLALETYMWKLVKCGT